MAPDTVTNPDRDHDNDSADSAAAALTSSPSHRGVEQWNSIGFKIMLANTLALVLLGLGVVMFSEYKRSLVFTELSLLEDEARLWARALSMAEGSSRDLLRDTVEELTSVSPRQAYIFDPKGQLILHAAQMGPADSRRDELKDMIDEQRVGPSFVEPIAKFLLMVFPISYDLPSYPQTKSTNINDYPDAQAASDGNRALSAWVNEQGKLIFTAAVPIEQHGQKRGTLLLIKDSTQTEEAFQMARIDVVRILLAALVITLTLALYVAFMVARPLNRLARAAEGMRLLKQRVQLIPDLSDRGDEIGALSVVLRETTQALWDRMDEIEHFAADVAHELKNPLTSLRSALETLPRIENAEKRQKLLAIMTEDTQRLDRLITDIAKASRLDAELSREEFFAVRIRDVFANIMRSYAPPETLSVSDLPRQITTRIRGIVLEILIPSDIPPVVGNPIRLQQVFDNLISNALSFSPDNARVVVCVERVENDRVRIMVDDQGPGIPDAKLETIFNRFYSERPQTEAFGIHSGLGLAIARQIVGAVSGKIYAENRIDEHGKRRGARFVVVLRVAK